MGYENLLRYPLAFLFAFLLSSVLCPMVIQLAKKLGMVDHPGERRLNSVEIPRGGGIAVFLAFHLSALVFIPAAQEHASLGNGGIDFTWWSGLVIASSIILIVGLYDDALGLRWFTKLAGQVAAASIIFNFGVQFDSIYGFVLGQPISLIFTIIWFVGMINAFNLIDGLDGLAAGLATIAALGLTCAALYRGLPGDSLLLLSLAGACCGFLRFNFYPARLFLGDSGSMVLGFTLAAIGLEGSSKGSTVAALGVPLLAAGVPIFDMVLAVWRRSIRAISGSGKILSRLVQPDMEHLHHRLLSNGRSQKGVAVLLYKLNALLVTFGVLTVVFNSRAAGILLFAIVVVIYVMVTNLAHLELWDSGTAMIAGIRAPDKHVSPAVLYPVVDVALLCTSLAITCYLMFQPETLQQVRGTFVTRIPIWCGVPMIFLAAAGTYRRVWSRARIADYGLLALALSAGFLISASVRMIMYPDIMRQTLLIAICHGGLSTSLLLGVRILPRFVEDLMIFLGDPRNKNYHRVLVYGAGSRGILYLKRPGRKNDVLGACPEKIVGFLDDDPRLRKRTVHGYFVFGSARDLAHVVGRTNPSEIVIACDLAEKDYEFMVQFCQEVGIRLSNWRVLEVLEPVIPDSNDVYYDAVKGT